MPFRKSFAFAYLALGYGLAAQQGALVFSRGGDIWIMGTDGANQTRLTSIGDATFPRLANNVLVFRSAGRLYRTTLQGYALSAAPLAVPDTSGVLEFDLSPDGARLVLTYFANNNSVLYTMNADGTARTASNTGAGLHQSGMSWGRDGFIYFVQSGFGNALSQVLYRIPENGVNNAVQLTGYFSQFPAAGGPGNKVVFQYNHPVKRLRTMNADGANQVDVPGIENGDGGYLGVDPFDDVIYYPVLDQIWRTRFDGSANQLLASGAFHNFVDYGTVAVDSVPPLVSSLTISPNPAPKATTIGLTASFTDVGGSGLALAHYTLDGASPQFMASLSGTTAGASIGLPGFPSAGLHILCVRAQDLAGNIGPFQCAMFPVYDPEGGFVTGGGWIPSAQGKAHFALVARYHKNASIPEGKFEFKADGFNFKSSGLAWMVVTNDTAVLRGSGNLNGVAGYQFEVTARDLAAGDRLGVRVSNLSGPVFESLPAPLGGGQIVVH